MKYCQELDLACLQTLARVSAMIPPHGAEPRHHTSGFSSVGSRTGEGDAKEKASARAEAWTNRFLLVDSDLHFLGVRCSVASGAGDIDGVDSSRGAAGGGSGGAGTATARQQQDHACDQAQDGPEEPAATSSSTGGADTEPDQAQASNGKPCSIERAAAEQAAVGHGAGYGGDGQRCGSASAARKGDGGGVEAGRG